MKPLLHDIRLVLLSAEIRDRISMYKRTGVPRCSPRLYLESICGFVNLGELMEKPCAR